MAHIITEDSKVFIARQPIFNRNLKVYGYELLFRSGLENFFDPNQDGSRATSKVITNSFLLIGIKNITEGAKAFINFPAEMICREYPGLFPAQITVIEILEDAKITAELIDACYNLRARGFRIALDDFVLKPGMEPLLKVAHLVKFDIRATRGDDLSRQVEEVKRYGIKLLAEKVETNDEFETTKAMGFDYFQGYFFSKPHIVQGRDIPGSKLQYLQILREINDDNFSFIKLATLISHDVSTSYKLLKYVNSAYFGLPREVESIQNAVAMIGEKNLRKFLALIMLSYLADDKPQELIKLSVLRARFCELIAERLLRQGAAAGEFFTIGMFSLLNAILDQPMAVLLEEINLSQHIKSSLLGKDKGMLFQTLHLVAAYERGTWENVSTLSRRLNISLDELPVLFGSAMESVKAFIKAV